MADQQGQPNRQLMLQKVYVKDLSFESPKAPEVFRQNPQIQTQLNVRTANNRIDDQNVEVTLTLTVESKEGAETLFLIELVQAGVFVIQGYDEQQTAALLGSFCPGTLYPFAREAVADVVGKGGFPQLLLQPINFDALYVQAQQQQMQQNAGEMTTTVEPGAPQPEAAPTGTTQGSGETH